MEDSLPTAHSLVHCPISRFLPFFLGDEHPIEFKFESNSTYNEKGAVEVYVKQPGGVTKHRFASLILYFCAAPTSEGGKAIRPQIIFRNQPKKPEKGTDDPVDPTIPASPLLLKEIRRYDKRVDVLYQENGCHLDCQFEISY